MVFTPITGCEDDARAVACAHEGVRRARRAVHEVPGAKTPLLALDDQDALAHEHEKVLLNVLSVVHPTRPSRLEHAEGANPPQV
jgi:hypothetical protein